MITSKKFADETFNKKPGPVRMAKIAWNIDPNDEDEPATVEEAINYPTHRSSGRKPLRTKSTLLSRTTHGISFHVHEIAKSSATNSSSNTRRTKRTKSHRLSG
jgi:hypothetical protein